MSYHHAPEADGTAKTRNLLAEAAEELARLEIEAGQAFRRNGERITISVAREILGTLRKRPLPRAARPPEPTGRLLGHWLEALGIVPPALGSSGVAAVGAATPGL